MKGFTAQSFVGVVVPAKTPAAIVDKLQGVIAKGLAAGSPSATKLTGIGAELASAEQMTGSMEMITGNVESQNEKTGILMKQIADLSDSIVVMSGKIEHMKSDSMDVVASIGEERHYNLLMRESVNIMTY